MRVGTPSAYRAGMDSHADLIERMAALRVRVAGGDRSLLGEMEKTLTQGYAAALSGEAQLARLEERLERILVPGGGSRADHYDAVTRRHRALEASVAALRSELATAYAEFVASGGGAR